MENTRGLLFPPPVKSTGGAGFNALAAFGTAGRKSLIKGSSHTGGKAAEFGGKKGQIYLLFTGLDTDAAFDTLGAVLDDVGMTDIIAQLLTGAWDGFGIAVVTFAVLPQSALVLVGAGTLDTAVTLFFELFRSHGEVHLFEGALALFKRDVFQLFPGSF
jgi:hypothetical protein